MSAQRRKARDAGKALTLPEILQTGIAQFTARIFELREQGFVIENEMQRAEGRVLSRTGCGTILSGMVRNERQPNNTQVTSRKRSQSGGA
jgi:Helix-turn-helix domain